jgi:branched-chain amino acid transport system ATP-binding protein
VKGHTTTILPAKQNARLALEISHRSYVFEIGKIALSGESKSLSEDSRIEKAYLGA